MRAISYQNTITTIPGWAPIHNDQPRGYAYQADGYNIHVYAHNDHLFIMSPGLTVTQVIGAASLDDWVAATFGAQNIVELQTPPGTVVAGVWRPGLYSESHIHQALSTNQFEQRSAEQALRILVEKLDEILLYIEPSPTGLGSYGHKTRELLILACTEIENAWSQYLRLAGSATVRPTTNQYVRLLRPLHLADYEISYSLFQTLPVVTPFRGWRASNPTASLPWYDAYNKTKHDRATHFNLATLENCLHAIAAAVVMFCVRYSPFPLLNSNGPLSGLIRQHMTIRLRDPDVTSFYVPLVQLPAAYQGHLVCGRADEFIGNWNQIPLTI